LEKAERKEQMPLSKVLVTGASGFIGKHAFTELHAQGHRALSLVRSGKGDIVVDLSKDMPLIPQIDFVVHCAGKAHSEHASVSEMHNDTVIATQRLLDALDMQHLKGFIFLSSVAVYGLDTGYMIHESATCQPVDAYGKAKFEAESIIMKWCVLHNIPYLILRLPLVVDVDAPGNLSKLRSALKKRMFFTVSGNNPLKSMVYINDLTEFIARQIISSIPKSGVFNLTDQSDCGFNDFVELYARRLHYPRPIKLKSQWVGFLAKLGDMIPFFPFNSKVYRKMNTTLTFDGSAAVQQLGWSPVPVRQYLVSDTKT